MTKHGKKYMMGGVKRTIMCPHCDYSTKGSIKEAEFKYSFHMKNKHNIDTNTMDRLYLGVKQIEDIHSSKISNEAVLMADLLKLLK